MIYSNFKTMTRDIIGYIRVTGAEVLVHDDPMRGYLGFCTEDLTVEWKIFLQPLASRHMFRQEQMSETEWNALKTAAGRVALVRSFVEQSKKDTITDPDYIVHLEKKWHDRMDRAPRTPSSEPGGHEGWQVKIEPGDDGLQ